MTYPETIMPAENANSFDDLDFLNQLLALGDGDPSDSDLAGSISENEAPQNLAALLRIQAQHPGWMPANGTSLYGYPYPPDGMSGMSVADVRQWGRRGLDVLANVEVGIEAGREDPGWLTDAKIWSLDVLALVSERLGSNDVELQAYSEAVWDRANAEVAEIRRELSGLEKASSANELTHIDWRKEGF